FQRLWDHVHGYPAHPDLDNGETHPVDRHGVTNRETAQVPDVALRPHGVDAPGDGHDLPQVLDDPGEHLLELDSDVGPDHADISDSHGPGLCHGGELTLQRGDTPAPREPP